MANPHSVVPDEAALGAATKEDDPGGLLGFLFSKKKQAEAGGTSAAMGDDPRRTTELLSSLVFQPSTPPGGIPGGGGATMGQNGIQPSGAGAGPSGGAPAGPAPVQAPAQAGPAPVPPEIRAFAQRAAPQPEFIDKLGAFFAGMGQGNGKILPALGHGWLAAKGLGPQMEQQQGRMVETYQALRGAGASHSEAMAAMLDPKVSEKVLGEVMPWNLRKPIDAGTDLYGQKQMTKYDPKKADYGAASGVGTGGVSGAAQLADPATGEPLRGQQFLDALAKGTTPAMAERVRKTARGELPFPTGMGAKSGIGARMADWVTQYDPNFNINESQARAKVWKDFADGPIAKNLGAFSILNQHVGRMAGTISKQDNYSSPYVNAARGAVAGALGPKASDYSKYVEQFNMQKNGVSHELGNVLKGSPTTVAELHTASEGLDPYKSPDIQRNNLVTALDMASDRISQIKDQWDSTYKGTEPYPKLVLDAERHLADSYAKLGAGGQQKEGSFPGKAPEPAQPAILGVPQGGAPGQAAPAAPMIAPGASPLGGTPGAPGAPGAVIPDGPVFNAPPPQGGPEGPAVLNPTAAPKPPAPAGLQNASFTPPPPPEAAAPGQGGQFANLPVVTTDQQITAVPMGKFFKTVTGDIFQRVQQAPGYVKIMAGKTDNAPQGGGAPAPAPAQAAPPPQGGPQGGQPGMQTAALSGGGDDGDVGMMEVGKDGIVHRYLGGGKADPKNWKAVTRSLVA